MRMGWSAFHACLSLLFGLMLGFCSYTPSYLDCGVPFYSKVVRFPFRAVTLTFTKMFIFPEL